jgi:site-specific DNA-methyltransferase (adenine-specific)
MIYYRDDLTTIHCGDSREVLKELSGNSIDSLVTDPPAGIGFMGKEWDKDKGGRDKWIGDISSIMKEVLRVLKPGAHGLVWSLPRTSYWTALALDDAGFEIRDCIYFIFQGFPKSINISKEIDRQAGADRKIIGKGRSGSRESHKSSYQMSQQKNNTFGGKYDITEPATPEAKKWDGWGTGLKPAVECWWLVRKPCSEKTVAENVLKWGTGALRVSLPSGKFASHLIVDTDLAFLNKFFISRKPSKQERSWGIKHPTVKSVSLMEDFIKLITPDDGTVLDSFLGSGTTCIAAKNLNKKFKFKSVGIEKEQEFCEISKKRLLGDLYADASFKKEKGFF